MNNEDTKYNGWTNYATWRIQLELVDDYVHSLTSDEDMPEEVTVEQLEDYVDDCLTNFGEIDDSLAVSYARAFVSDVNFYELAEHANERIVEYKKEVINND